MWWQFLSESVMSGCDAVVQDVIKEMLLLIVDAASRAEFFLALIIMIIVKALLYNLNY